MAEYKEISPDAPAGAKLLNWIDNRFPLTKLWNDQWGQYYAPKNFNWWYIFGILATVVLVNQIVTGIFLTMNYKPDASLNAAGVPVAFASVEYIMRNVSWGWLIRYMHSTGASFFFIVIYLHMFRGLMYGSYRKPRELVWVFGCAIFLCLMAEAFMGYLLPWGQMSYWGATVIVNLFGAIPFIGEPLSEWIRGDYVIGDATLNRFFSFHVIAVPLVLLGLVVAHLIALHEVGSNNPDGIEIKAKRGPDGHPLDGIPSHPYYTMHDIFGVVMFLFVFAAIIFFAPTMGGYFLEANNFIPANPMQGPNEISPVWYFTPFYSMLRATTDQMVMVFMVIAAVAGIWVALKSFAKGRGKTGIIAFVAAVVVVGLLWMLQAKFWGVVVMGVSVVILFFMPWLDYCQVKSIRYRPGWHKLVYAVFVVFFLVLGYLGSKPPGVWGTIALTQTFSLDLAQTVAQIGTLVYLGFFALMPWWSRLGQCKRVPERVTFVAH
ncbi:MAG: cytochrome bc complex cytochrome b subunit [Burkholderiaceae bacterium]|jgi:ubiquinol-cytochrome c reductase cytochrome b subunit|nr:cytochrome bc complex cytochrome b subunit [Burkholderiaceae bacterium]